MDELRKFVLTELKQRDMSQRQFADYIGVSSGTISRMLNLTQPDNSVSVEFILKLSKATNTNVITLLLMAYPEVAGEINVNPTAELVAERFSRLPAQTQKMFLTLINEWTAQSDVAE
jgi:transcriptional regulator with XRE-family HTH domain